MNALRYYATVTITRLYFIAALFFSFTEIWHGFLRLGTDPSRAWFAPICIDLFAVLGAIARSHVFTDRTRSIGFRVQVVASLVSLAANVGFGQSVGDRIEGAMIVAGYVFSEWFADNMERRQAEAKTEASTVDTHTFTVPMPPLDIEALKAEIRAALAAEATAATTPAAKPAKATRKGQPWSPERRARFEAKKAVDTAIAELEDRITMASAPTSPAPGENAAYL